MSVLFSPSQLSRFVRQPVVAEITILPTSLLRSGRFILRGQCAHRGTSKHDKRSALTPTRIHASAADDRSRAWFPASGNCVVRVSAVSQAQGYVDSFRENYDWSGARLGSSMGAYEDYFEIDDAFTCPGGEMRNSPITS